MSDAEAKIACPYKSYTYVEVKVDGRFFVITSILAAVFSSFSIGANTALLLLAVAADDDVTLNTSVVKSS